MLLLRLGHGRVEFDQDFTCFDALPVMNVNRAYDAGVEGLYQLNPAARHDFAGS